MIYQTVTPKDKFVVIGKLDVEPFKRLPFEMISQIFSLAFQDVLRVHEALTVCKAFNHQKHLMFFSIQVLKPILAVPKLEIAQTVKQLTNLQVLDLGDWFNGALNLQLCLPYLAKLKSLALSAFIPFSNETWRILKSSCTRLTKLKLFRAQVTGKDFANGGGLSSLNKLELIDCYQLTDDGLKEWIQKGAPQLSYLWLQTGIQGRRTTPSGVTCALAGCTSLKKLFIKEYQNVSLSSIWQANTSLTNLSIQALALLRQERLQLQQKLVRLGLHWTTHDAVTQVLASAPNVDTLFVSLKHDQDWRLVVSALKESSQLKMVNLRCPIRAENNLHLDQFKIILKTTPFLLNFKLYNTICPNKKEITFRFQIFPKENVLQSFEWENFHQGRWLLNSLELIRGADKESYDVTFAYTHL